MMQEANEKLQEEERKRGIEQMRREKDEHDKYKLELREKLRQDYIERFGREPPPEEEQKEASIKEKSGKDQVVFFLNKLKKSYKDSDTAGYKTCLNTIKTFAKNLQENPQEEKYKKLKVDG